MHWIQVCACEGEPYYISDRVTEVTAAALNTGLNLTRCRQAGELWMLPDCLQRGLHLVHCRTMLVALRVRGVLRGPWQPPTLPQSTLPRA